MSVMVAQEGAPGGGSEAIALEATSGLRDVEAARARAAVQARIFPAWFGPVAALIVVGVGAVQSWSVDRKGFPVLLALVVTLVGLVAVRVVRWIATRRTGVVRRVPLSARLWRSRYGLLITAVACAVTWGAAVLLGAGGSASRLAVYVVAGLCVWGTFVWRNAAARQELARLRDEPGAV
ncbi:hypothetical protein [Streptomyces catenulae]|uniref:Integral membrane protein n=1 Tax=Streptomyces catenulae TaxID=66875 RepID=A0ABV2Z4G0_9ACTN|nr:hypothetical protein [Streptomyces catenulae]